MNSAKRYKIEDNDEDLPQSMQEFGYHFNEKGQLRRIEKDTPYEFVIKADDQKYNQKMYEQLGECITTYIYELLETEAGLEKIDIPIDASEDDSKGFIFASKDAWESEKLMVLIHGNGVVRAGQWARRLIMNDSLDSGTMLPFIARAKKNGYAVVVLNGNLNNSVTKEGVLRKIKNSGNPVEHGLYVWDTFIKNAKAKEISIIAHSFGGVVTKEILSTIDDQDFDRIKSVAFTDSVHYGSKKIDKKMKKICVNWITSDQPLNTKLKDSSDSENRSAGTKNHIETSWWSFEPIFEFIEEKSQASES